MKLSELRPCDSCGGPLIKKNQLPMFYVVRFSPALIDPEAANETLALNQYFHGHLDLAEAMSPAPDAVHVGMDEEKTADSKTELFLCQKCFHEKPLRFPELAEKRDLAIAKAESET